MKNNFTVKAIVFYVVALLVCLAFTGIVNVSLYLLMARIGLSEFGNLWAFRIGLALVEVGVCVLTVQEAADDILFAEHVNEFTTEPPEIIPTTTEETL